MLLSAPQENPLPSFVFKRNRMLSSWALTFGRKPVGRTRKFSALFFWNHQKICTPVKHFRQPPTLETTFFWFAFGSSWFVWKCKDKGKWDRRGMERPERSGLSRTWILIQFGLQTERPLGRKRRNDRKAIVSSHSMTKKKKKTKKHKKNKKRCNQQILALRGDFVFRNESEWSHFAEPQKEKQESLHLVALKERIFSRTTNTASKKQVWSEKRNSGKNTGMQAKSKRQPDRVSARDTDCSEANNSIAIVSNLSVWQGLNARAQPSLPGPQTPRAIWEIWWGLQLSKKM